MRPQIAVLILVLGIGCLILWTTRSLQPQSHKQEISFRGKPLRIWFYGSRSNFFSEQVRNSAQTALKGVGTNAFPFLLQQLKGESATPVILNLLRFIDWVASLLEYLV